MQVTNTSRGGLGLPDGTVVPAGGSVDVPADAWAAAKKHPIVAGWLKDGKLEIARGEAPPDATPSIPEAKHAGGGSYFVFDGDQKVGEAMTKEQAEAFNALSDAEKAAALKKD